jgi:hypothetical protein
MINHLIERLRGERGFSMITVSAALLLVMMTSAVALDAATGDLGISRDDKETKEAYAAAEAGIHDYLYHLNSDNAYWAKCTSVPMPNAVNQRWDGTGADTRTRWRSVPQPAGDPRTAKIEYAIELLPANGESACDTNDAAGSMLDSTSGTFRIRSTGRVKRPDGTYEKRSIIGQFRRRGFLDFLYYTDFETSDPAWYELQAQGKATNPDLVTWASNNCARYWRDGRGSRYYYDPNGDFNQDAQWFDNGAWEPFPGWVTCSAIQFANGDRIRGPFHSNDDILICGSPDFGRGPEDAIEVSAPAPGWRSSCGGSSPTFIGDWKPNSPIVAMPPSNTQLKKEAPPAYTFTGRTEIELTGNSMLVTNPAAGLTNASRPLPPNGVVYVQNGACGQGYRPLAPYSAPVGCADVYIKGPYSGDMTIASEKDIIVWGNVTRAADNMLGLIANNFVRVYHPVTNLNAANRTCSHAAGTMQNVRIDAAILSLQHSFTVDHYFCGGPLQTLTVDGAIAQKFRGPVGTGGGGGVSNGYLKDYNYDDRLRLRQPPHFLDPVQSAWRMMRQWEQVPAL